MELETKFDSYDNPIFRVKVPAGKRMPSLGWFATEEEAIQSYEEYLRTH